MWNRGGKVELKWFDNIEGEIEGEGGLEALNNLTSRGIYYIMKSVADELQKH